MSARFFCCAQEEELTASVEVCRDIAARALVVRLTAEVEVSIELTRALSHRRTAAGLAALDDGRRRGVVALRWDRVRCAGLVLRAIRLTSTTTGTPEARPRAVDAMSGEVVVARVNEDGGPLTLTEDLTANKSANVPVARQPEILTGTGSS